MMPPMMGGGHYGGHHPHHFAQTSDHADVNTAEVAAPSQNLVEVAENEEPSSNDDII